MAALISEGQKLIDHIKFTLMSPNEIRRLSVVEVQTPDTYDEYGVPIVGGLMDERLGTLEPRQKCKTCGNTAANCPGHFGHIELAAPVIHISFAKLIHKLLTVTCRICGRLLIKDDKIEELKASMEKLASDLREVPQDFYEKVVGMAKKNADCPHCGSKQHTIEYSKPTAYYELIDGGASRLTPSAIRERLERIPDEDLPLLGIDPSSTRPEWMVLQVLPVPPVSVRPSIILETGIRSEDDLTHKLVDIIRINQKLKEALEAGVPTNIVQELHDLLQYHVTTYFDNEVSGLPPARHRSGRALKTLGQRLKGKEGRFRGNLSGKRVDFSARTVISPDINISIEEVGVPLEVAVRLTIPERVTFWNIEEMRQLIINGPDNYPGAVYLIRPDGRRVRLDYVPNRESLAESIQPGFVVERHLRDGDIVLFNRQPSLHRMSIMAHKVKVLPYETFRLNPNVCPPYNADFDGDEMNLHVPQSEEARTESKLLMEVPNQILSPRYGGPIIGAKTDLLTAAFLLTKGGMYLTKDDVCRLLTAAGYEGPLPPPAIKKPRELWSGKQIFSLFLPKGFNFVGKSSIATEEDGQMVVVKDGTLEGGVIDKNSIGAEKSETLLHRLVKDYGPEAACDFLNKISRLLDRFLTLKGFTYAADELDVPPEVKESIRKIVEKAELRVQELIQSYKEGRLDRLPGRTLEETLEIYIMDELSKARDAAGEAADKWLKPDNSGVVMTKTGARGSSLNIAQMIATVGQQSIRGKRIEGGYRGRTLSYFKPGELGPEARGFVYSSFNDGLNPVEYFFHAMTGRDGLIDTAVRTQQSGYLQRRLINALEDLRVEYDGTVRNSAHELIQFKYGEDGVDPAKSDHGKAVNVDRLIESVKLAFGKGGPAPRSYIAEKVGEVKEELPPLLVEDLRRALLKARLPKKGVDEAIKQTVKNYRKSLIEPGEAIGIVAAQSIGEPGTQMSLAYDEKVLVRVAGQVKSVKIGEFVDKLMEQYTVTREGVTEWCDLHPQTGIEVLSLTQEGRLEWKPLRSVSRHRYEQKLLRLTTRTGRTIIATDSHSFVTRLHGTIVPIRGRELKCGDRIPVLKNLPIPVPKASLEVEELLPKDQYWHGSELAKARSLGNLWIEGYGKNYTVPVGIGQLRNHLQGEYAFELEEGYVYPYQNHGNARIPETLELDPLLGWFVGAYLSEGSSTRYTVGISNTEEAFLQHVRAFAQRLRVSYEEEDNPRGFSLGHDLTMRSLLLSTFLEKACGRGSKNKRVPDFALGAPEAFVRALLQAYFEGDGNVSVERKALRASSKSEELINGIALLLARFGILASKKREKDGSYTLWIPARYTLLFREKIGFNSPEKKEELDRLCASAQANKRYTSDALDMICGFGSLLKDLARKLGIPTRYVNNFTRRQRIGRATLARYLELFERKAREKNVSAEEELRTLRAYLEEDVIWDEIVKIEYVDAPKEKVYDFSVPGLETFTTAQGIVTHNTLRTFHFAGVREKNVTLGLPRLIEIFDARRTPSTPTMTIYLSGQHRFSRDKAQHVANLITFTSLGDLVAGMPVERDLAALRIKMKLNQKVMRDRGISIKEVRNALEAIKDLAVKVDAEEVVVTAKEMDPDQFKKLEEKLLSTRIRGVPAIKKALVMKEGNEWVISTEGSALAEVLRIRGVDPIRTKTNDIHEVAEVLGIEAARNVLIQEAIGVLQEQGLDVDIRHIMLVADAMTASGQILQVGRHGVSGEKASVLAKAAFEITVPTIVEAAVKGAVDALKGVAENVIVGQEIPMGTGAIEVYMRVPEAR